MARCSSSPPPLDSRPSAAWSQLSARSDPVFVPTASGEPWDLPRTFTRGVPHPTLTLMFVGAAGGGAGPTVGSHNSFFSVFIYLPKDISLLLYRFDGADYLSRQYVPPPLPPLVRRSYVAVVVVSSLYDDLLWYRLPADFSWSSQKLTASLTNSLLAWSKVTLPLRRSAASARGTLAARPCRSSRSSAQTSR